MHHQNARCFCDRQLACASFDWRLIQCRTPTARDGCPSSEGAATLMLGSLFARIGAYLKRVESEQVCHRLLDYHDHRFDFPPARHPCLPRKHREGPLLLEL